MPPGNLKEGGARENGGRNAERNEEERVTASLEKFSTLANTTNIVDLTTKARSTDDLKKIPRFDPKERASASRKRPRSGLPLVEDFTTAELTSLIQEAVKTALKETNKEIDLLRKEVAGLQKRLYSLTRKQAKEESDISPKDHTTNAERRIMIKRKNENGPCPASVLVVAMNAALSKARAPPHIRVQKVETSEKGTVTACVGPKATGLMALKFKDSPKGNK
ncbi:hypothetical protein EX30DRAFT_351700 [Ascodesmis nigricans]|uniref:Uncharacterized protein n=1 Tax=Ascodesmis nigricans TaxID=341454 RepID=A0A4S2MRE4_9PEZI|nr:hypothetical protein EX30DRAFT_351700 [Ascodesmis nigricans]